MDKLLWSLAGAILVAALAMGTYIIGLNDGVQIGFKQCPKCKLPGCPSSIKRI